MSKVEDISHVSKFMPRPRDEALISSIDFALSSIDFGLLEIFFLFLTLFSNYFQL